MLIFGWGTRQHVIGDGNFQCPVCHSSAPYSHLRQRKWFSLFFVPIIPISRPQDLLRCNKCQTTIPMQPLSGQSPAATEAARSSYVALCGMALGILALLTVCVFRVSFPFALSAVIMGHAALQTIRKNRPHVEGRWQAITALVTGYSALLFSITIGVAILLAPRWMPPDGVDDPNAEELVTGQLDGGSSFSNSAQEAFKGAEYEIASKRDEPAGRGNSPEAIALAGVFAEKMKEFSDEVFTSGRRPLLQLSDGEYLTYCELHDDRCLFLVHVPAYRKFTGDAKKALAEIAWAVAQTAVAGKMPAGSKLGVGLRGVLTYGDIILGDCPPSSDSVITRYRAGKKEDLLAFFENDIAKPTEPAAVADQLASPERESSSEQTAKEAISAGQPEDQPIAGATAAATAPLEIPSVDARSTSPGKDLQTGSVPPPTSEPARPSAEPEKAMARTETKRQRKRSRPADDFVNQISIQLVKKIENERWGFTSLAFSPDGRWLVGGKLDQAVYVFDAASADTVCKLEKLDNFSRVAAVAFSHDSEYLVAGGDSGQTLCWKVDADGSLKDQQSQYRFDSEIELLLTSPKYPFLLGASRKGTIGWQSFGAKKSQPRLLQEFEKNVRAVWLPTNNNEAQATDGLKLIKFSLRDGQVSSTRDLGVKYTQFAAFSPSGKRLAVCDYDGLHMFDLSDSGRNRMAKLPPGETMHSLHFHPNETWIAAGMRGKVAIFDFEKAELIAYANTESIFYNSNIAFSTDGKYLAACSQTGMDPIKIFQMPDYP